MRYLGMDVHAKSTVWCLLDEQGEVTREGRVSTTPPALGALLEELGTAGEVVAGQEVGTLTYLVHDAVTAAGTTLLSFNAHQLRMIAASRKKTDRRDAYWIAKALQSGMYPHPVYVPTGEIRELRGLLWEMYRRHFGQDGDVLVWQAPTVAMNPGVPAHVIANAYAEDEAAAAAEYGAEFRRDIEAYVSREVLDAVVVPGWHELPGVGDTAYAAFVDPSGGSQDSMTLAIAHQGPEGVAVLSAKVELLDHPRLIAQLYSLEGHSAH